MNNPLHNEYPADSLEAKDLEYIFHPTTNLKQLAATGPKVHARAKGVYMWDNHGKQYLEGMAGLWCTALGYGEEELVEAAASQMRTLSYSQLFGGKTNEPSVLLAEKLKAMMPFDAGRVFFGLSGSDANDTQMKLMWYYHNAIGRKEKKKIISRLRGYHGVTVASGSLTGLPYFHSHFDLPIANVLHTDAPHYYRGAEAGESEGEYVRRLVKNLEALIVKEGAETIAAMIAEPVMGAGGVVVPPQGYFEAVGEVLSRHGIFLIDDEVICGFGRTGKPFGAETLGMKPTTMSVAKALSSAYLPISGVIIPEFMYEPMAELSGTMGTFAHGFTYSGHPVCAAVALRTLEIFEEREIFAHVARISGPFQQRLKAFGDHPLVGEARGVGLIGAVELVQDKATKRGFAGKQGVGAYCAARAEANGLIVRNLGDSVAFCPPLIISEAEVDELFTKFDKALNETWAWVRSGS